METDTTSCEVGEPKSQRMATPESRKMAAVVALYEAIDICIAYEGRPDERLALLAQAEDRFNREMGEQLFAAFKMYARNTGMVPLAKGAGSRYIQIGDGGFPVQIRATERVQPSAFPLTAFVVAARVPCVNMGPHECYDYSVCGQFVSCHYTGRHPADEARMWSPWWMACVDALTMGWDDLIGGPCLSRVGRSRGGHIRKRVGGADRRSLLQRRSRTCAHPARRGRIAHGRRRTQQSRLQVHLERAVCRNAHGPTEALVGTPRDGPTRARSRQTPLGVGLL